MTPRRVLRTYYGLAGLYTLAASLVWGVNTLFLLAAGLDIFEIFIANAAYTLAIVIFEIPTGVVADTRGRRVSLLLSVACLLTDTLVYIGAARVGLGLPVFCLGAAILGLGATFYSGAIEAWLVDGLRGSGYRDTLDAPLARGQVVTSAITVLGTVGGGLLATVDLSYPYLLRAALLITLFVVALGWMHEIGFEPSKLRRSTLVAEMQRIAHASIDHGWRQKTVRGLLFVGLLQFGFLSWAFHAWQPYLLDLLGRDAPWVAGLIAALITLATLTGNAVVGGLSRGTHRRRTHRQRANLLLWVTAIQTLAAVAVGWTDSFAEAIVGLLVLSAATGVIGPVKQAYLHEVTPSRLRATTLSLDSLLGNAGGSVGQVGLGAYARTQSIAASYVVGGLMTGLALPVLAWIRKMPTEQE